ncbi:MAG TPA: OmpA family protein [Bryobacteraceae bacterium]|nr:OmpA family protein [Bryobacteraceae bacterium]
MLHRFATFTGLLCLSALIAQAQGLNSNASKDDWEEINFEFNSAVLSDGYPSLLRLADLLKNNPGYHVRVEGNTDNIGGTGYNEKLGLERANTVRDFLVKYGAHADQIETASRGKTNPESHGFKRHYSKTDVARWMNRRVVLTVTDQNGKTVSAAGVGEAIKGIEAQPNTCCQDILKRLDKLDEIAQMLKDMAAQNAGLKDQLADLQKREKALEDQVNGMPKPLTGSQTAAVVDQRLEKFRDPRFSLLGFNVGRDTFNDYLTVDASGRFFAPFKDHFAFQAQGEYMYFHDWHEAQFDFGLVNRVGQAQVGAFGSFKHVDLAGYQNGALLGQAAITYDILFSRGKVGVFGTKSFLNGGVINSANATFVNGAGATVTAPNLFTETTLNVVDQAGLSTTLGLWGRTYLEANIGGLHSAGHGGRAGGSGKLVFPIADRLAFTIGGGFNETLLDTHNWGSISAGVEVGNFIRPKEYLATNRPVPVDIPRIRWELLTRTTVRGASPPVADAGPDQLGVPAGVKVLNGSRSYDPNGLSLTYAWQQDGGPSVALTGANTPTASFNAAAGQSYSFILTVRNTAGLSASARVRITTTTPQNAIILFFTANPSSITSGQASTLQWSTQNATVVNIPGVGSNLPPSGSMAVHPTKNTVYTLTASNSFSSQSAQASVNVGTPTVVVQPQPLIVSFSANPSTINQGASSTLTWQVQNATSVNISPTVGSVAENGTASVSPNATTVYTITATNASGQKATANATVTVRTTPVAPTITSFTANPSTITTSGGSSVLTCTASNATSVAITGAGVSGGTGASSATTTVTPSTTTTYTCTATGAGGTTSQDVTVTVNTSGGGGNGGPVINVAGGPVLIVYTPDVTIDLTGTTSPTNAYPITYNTVSADGIGGVTNGNTPTPQLFFPAVNQQSYTFKITATDAKGKQSTYLLTVVYEGATTNP